jgi:hypothetical protein
LHPIAVIQPAASLFFSGSCEKCSKSIRTRCAGLAARRLAKSPAMAAQAAALTRGYRWQF